jgi:hypothetical protein
LGQHDRLIGPIVAGGQGHVRHSFVKGKPLVVDGALPFLDMDQLSHDCFRRSKPSKRGVPHKLKEAIRPTSRSGVEAGSATSCAGHCSV